MATSTIVRLHASITLDADNWNSFQQLVAEVKSIVSLEEPGHVITHETYYQKDSFDCLIVEAYANEKAFLTHLEKIEPLSQKWKVQWKVNRMELSGLISNQTVTALKEMVKEGEFLFYDNRL